MLGKVAVAVHCTCRFQMTETKAMFCLVAMSALAWAPRMASGWRAHDLLVNPTASLGPHDEKAVGGDAILTVEGSTIGLCQPALA
jgi:hypothetical protein